MEVRLAKGEFARRPEQRAEGAGVSQDHRKPRGLSRLGAPNAAVPQPEGEVARMEVAEDLLEEGKALLGDAVERGRDGLPGGWRHDSHIHGTPDEITSLAFVETIRVFHGSSRRKDEAGVRTDPPPKRLPAHCQHD